MARARGSAVVGGSSSRCSRAFFCCSEAKLVVVTAATLLLVLTATAAAAADAPTPPPPPPTPLCSGAAGAPISPGLLACSFNGVVASRDTLELAVDVSPEDSEYDLRFWLETLVAEADVSLQPPGDGAPLPATRLYSNDDDDGDSNNDDKAQRAQWLLRARASPGRWVVRVVVKSSNGNNNNSTQNNWPVYVAARLAAVPSRVTLAAVDRAALGALAKQCCDSSGGKGKDDRPPPGPACALLRDATTTSPPVRDLCHAEANACDAQGRVTELFLGTGGLDCGAGGLREGSNNNNNGTTALNPLALVSRLAALRALDLSGAKGVDATAASVSKMLSDLTRLRHLSLDRGAVLKGTELACGFLASGGANGGNNPPQLLSLSLEESGLVGSSGGGVPACFLGVESVPSPLRRVYLGGNALEGPFMVAAAAKGSASGSSSSWFFGGKSSSTTPRIGPSLEVLWMPAIQPPPAGLTGDLPSWSGADRLRVVNLNGAGEGLGGRGGGFEGGGKESDASEQRKQQQQQQQELESSLEQAGSIVFFDARGTGLAKSVNRALLWDDGPGGEGGLTSGGGGGTRARLSAGAIAGIVLGCLAAVAAVVGCAVGGICCAVKRRSGTKRREGFTTGGAAGAAFAGDVEVTTGLGLGLGKAAGGGGGGGGTAVTGSTPATAATAAAVEAGLGHQGEL